MSSIDIELQIFTELVDQLISEAGVVVGHNLTERANLYGNSGIGHLLIAKRVYNGDNITFTLDTKSQEFRLEYWNVISIHDPEFKSKLLLALKNRIAFTDRNVVPFGWQNINGSDLNAIL